MTQENETKSASGKTNCAVWSGRLNGTRVAQLIQQQLKKDVLPLLLYRDPVNGPAPLKKFQGLAKPNDLEWNANDAPLAEARLFYVDGVLDLLADGSSIRWAAWRETGQETLGSCPAWTPEALQDSGRPFAASFRDQAILLRKQPEAGRVYTGLGEVLLDENKLNARLYYEAGILQWWRFMFNG